MAGIPRPKRTGPPFCLPLAKQAHLVRRARVPALAGGALASSSPGRPRLGLRLPAGLGCVPGLGTWMKQGAGRGTASGPHSPRPPPLPFPAVAAMNSRCELRAQSALGPLGVVSGSLCPRRSPTPRPTPALFLPAPSRENLLERDVTQPRDFTLLLARWPEPETTVSKYRCTLGPSLRPWNWRTAWDPLYLFNKEPCSTYYVSTQ